MIPEKIQFNRLKFNLHAIPICLAALVMWAIIGGWVVTVVPQNLSGPDNIGIVLSIFGLCLFLADRLALLWFEIHCQVLVLPIWMWGIIFIVWGLLEWRRAFSRQYLSIFVIHWSAFLLVIAATTLLIRRRRRTSK